MTNTWFCSLGDRMRCVEFHCDNPIKNEEKQQPNFTRIPLRQCRSADTIFRQIFWVNSLIFGQTFKIDLPNRCECQNNGAIKTNKFDCTGTINSYNFMAIQIIFPYRFIAMGVYEFDVVHNECSQCLLALLGLSWCDDLSWRGHI